MGGRETGVALTPRDHGWRPPPVAAPPNPKPALDWKRLIAPAFTLLEPGGEQKNRLVRGGALSISKNCQADEAGGRLGNAA